MTEDFEMKKAWLRRYQESQREEKLLMEEIEQLKAAATRVTPCLSVAPGGAGQGDSLPRAVEKIMEIQQRLQFQVNCTYAVRTEIVEKINTVKSTQEREILRRRYLLGQKWEEIACAMRIDYRWLLRQHKRALEKLKFEI